MLGLKLNHVSKRGHSNADNITMSWRHHALNIGLTPRSTAWMMRGITLSTILLPVTANFFIKDTESSCDVRARWALRRTCGNKLIVSFIMLNVVFEFSIIKTRFSIYMYNITREIYTRFALCCVWLGLEINRSCPYPSPTIPVGPRPKMSLTMMEIGLLTVYQCYNIGFNHGMLGLAENPARGTGFWSQNIEGVARGVLTEKVRPYYSMSFRCNTAIIVFKLLALVEWKSRYQLQTPLLGKTNCC